MSLSKKNIKNEFKVIEAWPFNPNAMDMKRPNQVMYTFQPTLRSTYQMKIDDFDGTTNDNQQWGKDGIIV
jgi:hypothetical protein